MTPKRQLDVYEKTITRNSLSKYTELNSILKVKLQEMDIMIDDGGLEVSYFEQLEKLEKEITDIKCMVSDESDSEKKDRLKVKLKLKKHLHKKGVYANYKERLQQLKTNRREIKEQVKSNNEHITIMKDQLRNGVIIKQPIKEEKKDG